MQKKRPIIAYIFTFLIGVVAAIITYQSLNHLKIYSGNSGYLIKLLTGRDWITLCMGVPLLLITGFMALRESNRAYLAWMGTLVYFLCTYLWYACGIAYNRFFLIYIVLFVLALFSFIRALLALDAEIFFLRFSTKTPIKFTAILLFFSGLALGYRWLHPMIPALEVGKQPDLLLLYGSTAMINLVLHLGIISPLAVITSLWIWKRKPWGFITASILLLYGLTSGLAFLAAEWIAYHHGQRINFNEILIAGGLVFLIFILWIVFLKSLREESIQDYHSRISSMM